MTDIVNTLTTILNSVRDTLSEKPLMGLLVILVTVVIFVITIWISTYSITKIIRAKKGNEVVQVNMKVLSSNLRDILYRFDRLHIEGVELEKDKLLICSIDLMKDQMQKVGDRVRTVKEDILSKVEIHFKKRKNNKSYRSIIISLDLVISEFLTQFRNICREGNFTHIENKEFDEFTKQQVELFKTIGVRHLNNVEFKDSTIKIEEVFDNYWEKNIKDIIKELLEDIRQLNDKAHNVVKKKEVDHSKKYNKFIAGMFDGLLKGVLDEKKSS